MRNNLWSLAIAGLLLCQALAGMAASSSSVLVGGKSYLIDKWDTDDGPPLSSITAITQTPDGYLWLGTLNGLVRFDGIRFTVFDENNTPGLASSHIASLFVDSHGSMWIGTENAGVVFLKDGVAHSLGIGLGRREGAAMCEDSKAGVWIHTADGNLWRFANGETNGLLVRSNLISPYEYRTVISEQDGTVWVGTDLMQFEVAGQGTMASTSEGVPLSRLDYLLASRKGGYWRLSGKRGVQGTLVQKCKGETVEKELGEHPWGVLPKLTACEDRDGNLLVGTKGNGLFWFDADGKTTALSTNEGLSHNIITALFMDHEGDLWVGTEGGGLNRVKRQGFDVLEQTSGWVIQSVCEDASGGLWIGSNGKGAACWKDGALRRFAIGPGIVLGPSIYDWPVWTIFVDRKNRVWLGTKGAGLYQLQNGRFQQVGAREIQAAFEDRQGRMWFGSMEGLICLEENTFKVFTTKDGLSSDAVRAIAEDRDGGLWVGTIGGGLNYFKNGKFTIYRKEPRGLPNDKISSLYVDADGVLWIGTEGGGLARLQAGQWTRYTTDDGLVSNRIGYMIEDEQGYLWVASNAGLMRLQKSSLNEMARNGSRTNTLSCRVYEKPDGLPTRECTFGSQPGGWRMRDGQLCFPTLKGLASVKPDQLKPNTNPPPVVIESVLLDNVPQNTNGLLAGRLKQVIVPAGKERVEIHYTSLNLSTGERGRRYRYMLQGHETGLIQAGNRSSVIYTKLPPHRYQFMVTACNEDGIWNPAGAMLEIIVLPPYWQTWWFLTSISILFLGSIVGGVHYASTKRLQRQVERLKQQETLEKERARIARDLHDQLGASLTQVALLGELAESDKEQPQEVESHARQISQTARETTRVLDEIVWAVNPSNDTLEGLVNYVCKYAQEYLAVAGLKYRLDVPSQLPNLTLPPDVRHNVFLASKEAVTNIVRHAEANSAWLRLKLEENKFILEIADDGRGVAGLDPKAPRTRNGLKNMFKRMEDIGGEFSIGPAPEGGALVTLSAPLRSVKEG